MNSTVRPDTLPNTTTARRRVAAVLDLPARFDVHEAPLALADLGDAATELGPGDVVLVDASAVTLMDHAGIDALVEARLRCLDAGGDLRLMAPSTATRVILDLTGDAEALPVIDRSGF